MASKLEYGLEGPIVMIVFSARVRKYTINLILNEQNFFTAHKKCFFKKTNFLYLKKNVQEI